MDGILSKKSFIISILSVFIQYYDYHLFGFLAINIASSFFPSDQVITQLINTYLIMTIAIIVKPIGAIVFGTIGDSRGRSSSFKMTLLGTALASIVMAVLPTYQSIGLVSCFILLVCRMVISTFVVSGSDGIRIYLYEHVSQSNQCLSTGIINAFILAGSLTASISAWFFTLSHFGGDSWRLAFLLGGVIGVVMVLIMKHIDFRDRVDIDDIQMLDDYKILSFKTIVRSHWRLLLSCTIIIGGVGVTGQFIVIFFGTYNFGILETVARSEMHSYITLSIILYMIFSVVSGYVADQFNRYYVNIIGSVVMIILSIVLLSHLYNLFLSSILYMLVVVCLPFITIPAMTMVKQSIPKSLRYRIFSLSHALGVVFISSPTALVSSLIYQATYITWLPICYFIINILMISCALYYLRYVITKK